MRNDRSDHRGSSARTGVRPAVLLLVLAFVGSSVLILNGPAAAQANDSVGVGSPADLQAHAGDGELRLTWLAPSAAVIGYDVQYKTRDAANQQASTPGDPSTGWVDAGHSGTDPSHTISGLRNSLRHFLRVRAIDASGSGPWAITGGAPTAPPDPNRFCQPIPRCGRELVVVPPVLRLEGPNSADLDEGRAVNVTVTFRPTPGVHLENDNDEEYPTDKVHTVYYSYLPVDTTVHVEVDTNHRHHTATEGEDFTLSTKKLTVVAYEKFASFQVRAHADRKNEGAEWIVLKLTPVSNAPYKMPEPIGVILKIWDFSREPQIYLLGPDSVGEGGKSVRVTAVLKYPAPEGGATVELSVGAGSTATEGKDFTMPATVTVPEGGYWATTYLPIVDDGIHEGPETIEVNAVNTATGLKDSRRITIHDNDPVPGPVQNLQLVPKGEGTRLRVKWDAPTSGGTVTRYEVTLQDSEGTTVDVRRPGSKKQHVVFRNLRSGATYQVSVLAKSGEGKGQVVTAHLTLD